MIVINVSGHIQVWGTNKASTYNDLDGYLAEGQFSLMDNN